MIVGPLVIMAFARVHIPDNVLADYPTSIHCNIYSNSRFETWGYLEISVPCNFMMGDDYIGLIKHF